MSLTKKKSSSRKRKTTHSYRRSRKPKIKLNKNRVMLLCGFISLICVVLLVVSVALNSPRKTAVAKNAAAEQQESLSEQSEKSTPAEEAPSSEEVNAPADEAQTTAAQASAAPAPSSSETDTAAANTEAASKNTASTKTAEPAKTIEPTKAAEPAKTVEQTKATASTKPAASATKTTAPAKTAAPATKTAAPAKAVASTKSTASPKPVASTKAPVAPSKSVVAPSAASNSQQKEPTAPAIPYDIPDAQRGATLVFIFDDAGQSVSKVKRYTSLPMPLTIAVLPQLPHSRECANAIRAAKKEVMLHQPMQAENLKINPGPGAITPDMSTFDIAEVLKKNLAEVGPVAGLNNHEGSLITEDEIKIGTVLDVAAEKNIYFVDSRTTAATKAPQAALERDMHIFERDVFLDDVVNKPQILAQIYRALGIANKKGKVIIIGHVDKSADIIPYLLRDMYPYLQMKGYRFAVPSQLK